jgi:tetratricopeptide (TPR) repeat protein
MSINFLSPDDLESLIDMICQNIEEDDLDKAMANTDRGLGYFSENPYLLNFKGFILSYNGYFNEALPWLLKSEQAFGKEKDDELIMVGKIENWINLSSTYVNIKNINLAFLSLYKAISCYGMEKNSLMAMAYFDRSQLHILNHSTTLALSDLQKTKDILEICFEDAQETSELYDTTLVLLNKYSKV